MMFRHPKYYKELRKRNRAGSIDGAMLPDSQSDQAISHANSTRGPSDVRPDPGHKPQASSNEELEGLKKYVREKKKPI